MKTSYDQEIREVEQRLALEREALATEARELAVRTREAAASPKGLLAAFAIGYILGELTAPRSRRSRETAAATTKKVGLGGLMGSALIAYVRSQYGSPVELGRRAWEYYAASQRARRAATERSSPPVRRYSAPAAASGAAQGTPPAAAAAATAHAPPVSPARAEASVRPREHHAAG